MGEMEEERMRPPIDLNTASKEQLQDNSRIGSAKAAKIVAGRPYRSVEDLLNIPGIGKKTSGEDQALRDRQELNGPTGRNSWDCRITLR